MFLYIAIPTVVISGLILLYIGEKEDEWNKRYHPHKDWKERLRSNKQAKISRIVDQIIVAVNLLNCL